MLFTQWFSIDAVVCFVELDDDRVKPKQALLDIRVPRSLLGGKLEMSALR